MFSSYPDLINAYATIIGGFTKDKNVFAKRGETVPNLGVFMPAKAAIRTWPHVVRPLDSRLRGNDIGTLQVADA